VTVPPHWRHGDFDYLRILTEADIWSSFETKGGGNVGDFGAATG
jgi:hypothetical protein